jgi:hypothetical protein
MHKLRARKALNALVDAYESSGVELGESANDVIVETACQANI